MNLLPFFIALVTCSVIYATPMTIGTNAEFAPFTFVQDGEIVGFDIDVAKEVSKRLDKEPRFKDMPFDALMPDLLMGKVDFIAAGMTATEERAKRVAFTKPYMSQDPLVILTLPPAKNLDDLQGKTVIVNEGFNADIYLSDKPGIKLVRLPTTADAFMALASRRGDAFVTAQSTMERFMVTQDPTKYAWTVIPETAENCALVLTKKNTELLADIQKSLDAMEADGTLSQLRSKWGFK